MKYIRTKFGRIFKVDSEHNEHYYRVFVSKYCAYTLIDKLDVEKSAETIEKLLDGFIVGETPKIYNKSNFDFEKKMVNLGHKSWFKFENLASVYGITLAMVDGVPKITTVAKISEKGELELL